MTQEKDGENDYVSNSFSKSSNNIAIMPYLLVGIIVSFIILVVKIRNREKIVMF